MSTVVERAQRRRCRALELVDSLHYLERWGRLGDTELVGSVRHGLVVAHDIDVEVTVPALDVAATFAVVAEIALDPAVLRALYRNQSADRGWLYWELGVRLDGGEEWTIETYVSGPRDSYAGWSAELARSFDRVLTEEHRRSILELKEALADDPDYRAMDVYRGVVEGGVRTVKEFEAWRAVHGSTELVRWDPLTVPPS